MAIARPYVLAAEHARARKQVVQRERRTAAALATYGIDYDPQPAASER
ncbi:hypothetical protein [Streptomyces sp. NPDC058254]